MKTNRIFTVARSKKFWGTLVVGLVVAASASADLGVCANRRGSLRFWDAGTNRCGYVSADNSNWGNLPGGWNDRADEFGNDGVTHTVCIYQHSNYRGQNIELRRGYAVGWSNTVSSNDWTNGGCD